jgi:hypothetical protein
MKRIIAALLMLSCIAPLCAAAVPARAFTKDTPAADADVNFAEGIVWNKSVGGPKTEMTEEGVIMSNVSNAWDSAGCDILPALKAALGDGDSVTVKLSFELELRTKAGKESTPVNVRPLLRGSGSSSAATDAAWNSEYANSLGGDSTLFFRAGGNIMMNFANGLQPISQSFYHVCANAWNVHGVLLFSNENVRLATNIFHAFAKPPFSYKKRIMGSKFHCHSFTSTHYFVLRYLF